MLDQVDRHPILDALRTHVALDAEVSDALTALHAREGAGLGEVLSEARALATQLDPSGGSARSRLDLETWLRTILRGPHDSAWFDTRVECGRQGWTGVPPLASAVVIARLRHRLTEVAVAWHEPTDGMAARVAHALGRLFDLEMAIIILDIDTGGTALANRDEVDSLRPTQRDAALAIGNALAVIETSAYLIGRYSDAGAPRRSDVERHLDRIAKHVVRAKQEIAQLLHLMKGPGSLVH